MTIAARSRQSRYGLRSRGRLSSSYGGAPTWAFAVNTTGSHIVGRRGAFPFEAAFWIRLPAGVRYGLGDRLLERVEVTFRHG